MTTHGGKREGAGRKPRQEPKAKPIWCGQMSEAERAFILETLTPDERWQVLVDAAWDKRGYMKGATMNFWQLIDKQVCDNCGAAIIRIDGDIYYCQNCRAELTLCGMYGSCEGIAHNGPYRLEGAKLIEDYKLITGYCDTCGEGWEAT